MCTAHNLYTGFLLCTTVQEWDRAACTVHKIVYTMCVVHIFSVLYTPLCTVQITAHIFCILYTIVHNTVYSTEKMCTVHFLYVQYTSFVYCTEKICTAHLFMCSVHNISVLYRFYVCSTEILYAVHIKLYHSVCAVHTQISNDVSSTFFMCTVHSCTILYSTPLHY
jgi:hypothetical protein